MDVRVAAVSCLPLIKESELPMIDNEVGKNTLIDMVNQIVTGKIEGEQAHIWLGYIQGVLVLSGVCTLEEIKELNSKT